MQVRFTPRRNRFPRRADSVRHPPRPSDRLSRGRGRRCAGDYPTLPYELVTVEECPVDDEDLDAGERAVMAVVKVSGAVRLTDGLASGDTTADAEVEGHGSIGVITFG